MWPLKCNNKLKCLKCSPYVDLGEKNNLILDTAYWYEYITKLNRPRGMKFSYFVPFPHLGIALFILFLYEMQFQQRRFFSTAWKMSFFNILWHPYVREWSGQYMLQRGRRVHDRAEYHISVPRSLSIAESIGFAWVGFRCAKLTETVRWVKLNALIAFIRGHISCGMREIPKWRRSLVQIEWN